MPLVGNEWASVHLEGRAGTAVMKEPRRLKTEKGLARPVSQSHVLENVLPLPCKVLCSLHIGIVPKQYVL